MKKILFYIAEVIFALCGLIKFVDLCLNSMDNSKKVVANSEQTHPNKVSTVPVISYHIKVECYGTTGYYCIKFTNDNWQTSEKLFNTFDISGRWKEVDVVYDEFIEFKDTCLSVASKLRTYKEAKEFNALIYRDYIRLLNYRNDHPIPIKPEVIEDCCKTINVY